MWQLFAVIAGELAKLFMPWLFPRDSGMKSLEHEIAEKQKALEAKEREIEIMQEPDRSKSAVIIELRDHLKH